MVPSGARHFAAGGTESGAVPRVSYRKWITDSSTTIITPTLTKPTT
jgi:hypothetical protein